VVDVDIGVVIVVDKVVVGTVVNLKGRGEQKLK